MKIWPFFYFLQFETGVIRAGVKGAGIKRAGVKRAAKVYI